MTLYALIVIENEPIGGSVVRPRGDLFMPKCTSCNLTFDDVDAAKAHVRDAHSDLVDEKLMEYMDDAIDDAAEDVIQYGDDPF